MPRRAPGSNTVAFAPPPKKKKGFASQLTGFFKPLTNLFGGSNVLSAETKPLRDLIDIRTNNRNRGYRKNQYGKMTYFKDLDEERKKKKQDKKDEDSTAGKLFKTIFKKGKPVKMTNPKTNVTNKKGQKLTLIRPPSRKP